MLWLAIRTSGCKEFNFIHETRSTFKGNLITSTYTHTRADSRRLEHIASRWNRSIRGGVSMHHCKTALALGLQEEKCIKKTLFTLFYTDFALITEQINLPKQVVNQAPGFESQLKRNFYCTQGLLPSSGTTCLFKRRRCSTPRLCCTMFTTLQMLLFDISHMTLAAAMMVMLLCSTFFPSSTTQ